MLDPGQCNPASRIITDSCDRVADGGTGRARTRVSVRVSAGVSAQVPALVSPRVSARMLARVRSSRCRWLAGRATPPRASSSNPMPARKTDPDPPVAAGVRADGPRQCAAPERYPARGGTAPACRTVRGRQSSSMLGDGAVRSIGRPVQGRQAPADPLPPVEPPRSALQARNEDEGWRMTGQAPSRTSQAPGRAGAGRPGRRRPPTAWPTRPTDRP